MKNKRSKEDERDIIDLTSLGKDAAGIKVEYVCSNDDDESCHNVKLLDYPQAQIQNPFAGPSYRCPNCGRIYDSSLEKLQKASRKVRSSLGDDDSELIFETITEDREGYSSSIRDEYAEYDPEGDTDERMEKAGMHIISSEITLTDSEGRNRTIVKRDR